MDAALSRLRKEGFPVYDEDVIRIKSIENERCIDGKTSLLTNRCVYEPAIL